MSFFMAREVQRSNHDVRVIQKQERWNCTFPSSCAGSNHGQAQENVSSDNALREFYQSRGLSSAIEGAIKAI
jgi:hypothetical protein